MEKPELIDSHVSAKQCKLAVDSLLSYATKKQEADEQNELLPVKEQNIWVVVGVKQMYAGKKIKPFKIPIKYPLVDPRSDAVCLITKDPQREYKDLLETHGIKFISRVVGITKLKGKFKPFEARRMLLKENAMFLADERVVPLLPGLLGKKWFDAKKQPIPVCLTRKDLKGELERAISSTYMHQNQGTCTSVKVGTLSQSPAQVLANITTALPSIAKNIKGEWDNIQSLNIKTNSSVSLPIWNCSLDDERWKGLIAKAKDEVQESEEVSEEGDDEQEAEEEPPKRVKAQSKSAQTPAPVDTGKGKKRAADVHQDKPPKKAKGATKKVLSTTEPTASKSSTTSHSHTSPSKSASAKSKQAAVDGVSSIASRKHKRARDKLVAAAPAPDNRPAKVSSSFNADELKQKRKTTGTSMERKKDAVVKGVGKRKKSAKVDVLGSKAGRGL